jgi:DNA-binding NarL/FixJ family response regulator
MHEENIYGQRCLQLGAKGYLHKSATDAVILGAINRVLSGKKYISPDLAELLSDKKSGDANLNPLLRLSLREMEIILLLNKGKRWQKFAKHCKYSIQRQVLLNIEYSKS